MVTECQLRIAVCDDVTSERIQITAMVKEILLDAGISFCISEYGNGERLVSDIQNGAQYQLLMLDVMLDEARDPFNGIELAGLLRRQQNKSAIIFISSNREMAMSGYEVAAARYLAKPVDPAKMKEAVLFCCNDLLDRKEILLPTEQGNHRISIENIQYVEAFDRGTRVVLASETVASRLKFCEMEELLPDRLFLQCHRAFTVNLSSVKFIRHYEFELKSGDVVPISKGRYQEIHRQFVDYIAAG